MNKSILNLFFFFCFFPFIGLNIGTDMQPFALLLACIIIISTPKIKVKYSNYFFVFTLSVFILTIISLIFLPIISVVKRLYSYISIISIFIAAYSIGKKRAYPDFEKHAKIYMIIWGLVGAIQLAINRSFLCILIPLSRTTSTRGVCSLASEPSFYGYMCFFFFIISLGFKNNKHKIIFAAFSIAQTLFLAQSTVALLYFFVFGLTFSVIKLFHMELKKSAGIVIGCVIVFFLIKVWVSNNGNLRIVRFIQDFVNEPFNVFDKDESAKSRMSSILISFSRCGLPGLIGQMKLHSGFGSVFYELGIFSFSLFIPIWKSMYNAYSDKRMAWVVIISITISMLSGIQLSLPISAMFFGLCASNDIREKQYVTNRELEMDNTNECK